VDRLWPRGLRKDQAHVDVWLREVAPSTGLRKWFGHDPSRWEEFRERFYSELDRNPVVGELRRQARGNVTLLFGARETCYNNAEALREYLQSRPPNRH
jgi:uncharacterized protein YeaO (DUF488 family)